MGAFQYRRQHGLTSVEYVTAGSLVAVAVIVGFALFDPALEAALDFIVGAFS